MCDVNGVTTYVVNSGNVENKGIELSLNFNPINRAVSAKGKMKVLSGVLIHRSGRH